MPIAWFALAAIVGVLVAAGVGMAAAGSESAGVAASNLAAFPLGFVCTGAAVALVVHFVARGAGVRTAVPLGCGCLGGIGAFLALGLFYAAIWPSL